MNPLIGVINGAQEILGICPCCGEIFRLVEAKFIFPRQRVRPSEYLNLLKLEAQVSRDDVQLTRAEARFEERLNEEREALRSKGRRRAKRRLKRIDPVFSGRNVDPHDVRVIFDPVEFVVFHGLNASAGLSGVEFLSRAPSARGEEIVVEAISRAVRDGNIEFETLQLNNDGGFEVRKAKVA
jgi:predicted Holliday junction resolvase-like endonuclease